MSYEDHYKLMDEHERVMNKLQTEIKELYHFHREGKDSMAKHIAKGFQMEDMISELKTSIAKFRVEQKAFRGQMNAEMEALN